ncbi:MAG: hypothetical protein ACTHN8_09070 [Angustibacter sp.]
MPPRPRLLALLAAAVLVLAGCSAAPAQRPGGGSGSTPAGDVAEGTCWTGDLLGADPQRVLALARQFGVPYHAAARAVSAWPSFDHSVPCADAHAVEVVTVVRLPALDARLTDYATLLRERSRLAGTVARSVALGCMNRPLAAAAARAGLPNVVMEPALPAGATIGWAPAPPEQWRAGKRVFACTLTWRQPQTARYAALFTKALPTGMRTCIDSRALLYVDCARGHDRERIAVIEAREAVRSGAFPGPGAIRQGPQGRYLDVPDEMWARLDAACTAYLRAVSTTKRLTGVANVDVDEWPTPDGSFPISCDADRPPDEKSLVSRGSVYDRG